MNPNVKLPSPQNTPTIKVLFYRPAFSKTLGCPGTATARKGHSLLVTYHLADGQLRKRWIAGRDILWDETQGEWDGEGYSCQAFNDRAQLPQYKSRTCPAYELITPVDAHDCLDAQKVCPDCYGRHRPEHERQAECFTSLEDVPAHMQRSVSSPVSAFDEETTGTWAARTVITGFSSLKLQDVRVCHAPYIAIDALAECWLDTSSDAGQELYDHIWAIVQEDCDKRHPALVTAFQKAGGLAGYDSFEQWKREATAELDTSIYFTDCWSQFTPAEQLLVTLSSDNLVDQ